MIGGKRACHLSRSLTGILIISNITHLTLESNSKNVGKSECF